MPNLADSLVRVVLLDSEHELVLNLKTVSTLKGRQFWTVMKVF